ncbi:MAG: CopD family protein [Proteobacteria bacterium]|nr:CopD family protein [Pseudomonadota bacterium]
MSYSIAIHLLSAVIWVGGMIFAHNSLRPAAVQVLEPPLRLELWVQVFRRFFVLVWGSIALILITGYWMLFNYFGGFAGAGNHIHIMHGAGWIMVFVYMYVFFSPYRQLKHAVIVQDYPLAGAQLNRIRKLVGLNILIGMSVIIVASAGRYI